MSKYFLAAAVMTLVVVLGVAAVNEQPAHEDPPPPASRIDSIYATGFVQGLTENANLRTRVPGRVVAIRVRIGQHVEQGDTLLQLDDREQQQLANRAQARVALAHARLARLINGAHGEERREAQSLLHSRQIRYEQAVRKRDRLLSLSTQQAISQQDLDDQEALVSALNAEVAAARARFNLLESPTRDDDLAIARAELSIAAANLELAKLSLAHTRLLAPTPGTILDIAVRAGEITGPDSSKPVIVMADTSRTFVRAFVDELDAHRVQLGCGVLATADGLPTTLQGKVIARSPQMEQKWFASDAPEERRDTHVREILVELLNPPDLVVGLRVEARILLSKPLADAPTF